MRYIFLFLILVAFSTNVLALEEGPALTDREIIESLAELKVGQASMDKRFDDMGGRIDRLSNFILWGFGVTFTGIFALVGFVLWDRRTAFGPYGKET